MSVRYFRTSNGVAQYGNLTDEGAAVLADAGQEEITAEEYQEAQAKEGAAVEALRQSLMPAPAGSAEQLKEASSNGGNERKRRR